MVVVNMENKGLGKDIEILVHLIEYIGVINPNFCVDSDVFFNISDDYTRSLKFVYPILPNAVDVSKIDKRYMGLFAVEKIKSVDDNDILFIYYGSFFSFIGDSPTCIDSVSVFVNLDMVNPKFELLSAERIMGDKDMLNVEILLSKLKGN